MQDRASKANIYCVTIIAAVGLNTHIWWGITTLTQHGDWAKATIATVTLLAAWFHLISRCARLPSDTQHSFEESIPFFFRTMLPFSIPSVTTLSMLAFLGPMNLQSLFIMVWGLTLIFLLPAIVRICFWIYHWRKGRTNTLDF